MRRPPRTSPAAIAALKRLSTEKYRAGMARYGLPADRAFGVPVGDIQKLGKQIGKDHALALALWKSGWYEARMLASFVADPDRLTPAQMDRWCRDFDSWGICDTVCFVLFDKSPHAWKMMADWARRPEEFQRRTAFALLASLSLHDKRAPDTRFVRGLSLCRRYANDKRNFVKKGVSWAIRTIGHRNLELHAAAIAMANDLAKSSGATGRWVGKDVLRDLTRPVILTKLRARAARG